MASELNIDTDDGEAIARHFHGTYERLAPSFGYETRPDTKAFDPTTPNGRLMIAVCGEIAATWKVATRQPDAAVELLREVATDLGKLSDLTTEGFAASASVHIAERITAYLATLGEQP